MILTNLDWIVVASFFVVVIILSYLASRRSGSSKEEYFLAGKSMPWWLLGVSMVATTFSADTPNLITGFVREGGIAKNWFWWSFLITGMVTVFIYSRMWRRSGVLTDLEFYELRYGSKAARFLRGFRAIYLGLFFNCLIMGSVTLAAIKIASVLLGIDPLMTVIYSSVIIIIYSALGGIRGVIWTDFFQFLIAMTGATYAAYISVNDPQVGGLTQLMSHPDVASRLSFVPDLSNTSLLISMFIIPLAVQWWSVWYPGAEPGGGGYIAQRMFAAKDEKHAQWAVLFFNFAHYALRPWPWILVALASIVVYPSLESIGADFPAITSQYLGHDIAYPVMISRLSSGWLGLVIAALIAAYMSTMSTHLNWGSSYLVHDFYQRFLKPSASEKELVLVARLSVGVLMLISGGLALTIMENASQAFNMLLLSGAGTGTVFLLRWFWMRINATTELVAMLVASINAIVLTFFIEDSALSSDMVDGFSMKLIIATGVTTIAWLIALKLSSPEQEEITNRFQRMIKDETGNMGSKVLKIFIGTIGIYAALFGMGNFLYGNTLLAIGLCVILVASSYFVLKFKK